MNISKLSESERLRIEAIYTKLPNGLKKVGDAAELAIRRLVKKGYSYHIAESMVLEILEESKPYLEKKMYASTIKCFEMIF
ncbi:MAG: hypothetical protein WC827_04025 [Candidatus Paceibacterota bacterium]|jgi:hypothetical protein